MQPDSSIDLLMAYATANREGYGMLVRTKPLRVCRVCRLRRQEITNVCEVRGLSVGDVFCACILGPDYAAATREPVETGHKIRRMAMRAGAAMGRHEAERIRAELEGDTP